MPERKGFLLRLDPAMYAALQRWADDDLRSLNGQLEWLLRQSLRAAGRLPQVSAASVREDAETAGARSRRPGRAE